MSEKQKQKLKRKGEVDGGGKIKDKKETPLTVILKVDMHCDGCASKIVHCLRGFQGAETLKAESECGKLTVTGKVDPSKLREKLANKMKKKVDLISPQPQNNKDHNNKSNNNKPQDKKPKEAPVIKVVLKVALHCQGCIDRIRNTVSKTKGVQSMVIDREKDTVTVKGTMEVKALAGNLMKRLKRKVEVVPPKKESGEKKSSEKEGADDKEGNGGTKKKKGDGNGGGGDKVKDDQGKEKMKQTKMEPLAPAYGPLYGYGGYGFGYGYGGDYNYGPVYMEQLHAPQLFSDENPNACSIM